MVFKSIRFLSALGILVTSTSVHAAPSTLVDNGNYTTDLVSNVEWLDFSFTSGVVFNQAVSVASSVEGGGWRYATNGEVEGLFSQLFDPAIAYGMYSPLPYQNLDVTDFTDLFGSSYLYHSNDDTSIRSWGMFTDEDGIVRIGGVTDCLNSDCSFDYIYGLESELVYNTTTSGTPVSTYLVRDVSAVPVPAAVWLFGSGLIGLVGVARRTPRVLHRNI